MALPKYFVLLFVTFAVVNSLPVNNTKTLYKQEQWDHLLFVQVFPAGICYYSDAEGKGYMCNYPKNATTWTLHGLWPTLGSTKGPNFCNPDAGFDLSSISVLIPRLVKEWTNVLNETAFDSFWSHEWMKHGTCLETVETEYKFFSKVLDLFENGLNFGEVLANQSVIPGGSYHTGDFVNAFNQVLGVEPHLTCEYSKSTGQIVKQIHICLDNNYKPMNCPEKEYSNCRDNEELNYISSIYSRK